MTSKALREELQRRLGNVTPDAIYKRASKVKRTHGPMTTEDAINMMAADEGIDITKYLDAQNVDRVRQLRQARPSSAAPRPDRRERAKQGTRAMRVVIAGAVELCDPLLPRKIIDDAKVMAERVYPLLYLLENSVRELIVRVLRHAHGDGWWDVAVPPDVRQKVDERRSKEKQHPWHGRRGAHPIYYTDFAHLRRIVTARQNWQHFEPILHSQTWLTQKLEELDPSRNIIAHNNPLHKDDVERLTVYLRDWQRQIQDVRDLIPE